MDRWIDRSIDRWVDGPLGPPGAVLEPSGGLLGLSWGPLGGLLGSLGALLGSPGGLSGPSWGASWAPLSPLGSLLGPSWAQEGPKGALRASLGPSSGGGAAKIYFFSFFRGPTSLEATVYRFRRVTGRNRRKGVLE